MVKGLEFRVLRFYGLGFRAWIFGCRVQGSRCRVGILRFRAHFQKKGDRNIDPPQAQESLLWHPQMPNVFPRNFSFHAGQGLPLHTASQITDPSQELSQPFRVYIGGFGLKGSGFRV